MIWMLIVGFLGVLVTYPAYFYLLQEFRIRLSRDHPQLWADRIAANHAPGLGLAYKALREVQQGTLDGVVLSRPVADSHRLATRFLYAGVLFFIVLLFAGLYDSLWGAGWR